MDGFTIQSASEDGIFLDDSNVAIVNCKLQDNCSGGINCTNSSQVDIHDCLFIDNSSCGLNVTGTGSSALVSNSIFDGNDCTGEGMCISGSSVELADCSFKNHSSNSISGLNGTLTIHGCSFDSDKYDDAINIENITTTVVDSIISNSGGYGLNAVKCNLEIDRCILSNNFSRGLSFSTPQQKNLTLKDSIIRYNGGDGINLYSGGFSMNTTIINNWIHNNAGSGIFITNPKSILTIRNNTIYKNSNYGVYYNSVQLPAISNCIIWGNGDDLYNCSATFSCIKDNDGGNGNIHVDPGFMNPSDPNDLHIGENSPCIDTGSGIPVDEVDIDGEARVKDGDANGSCIVDIGADEFYWSPADFDRDEDVDFSDYAIFAYAWLREVQGGNFEIFDLEDDNKIDCGDLELFCEDWLWQPGWENGWMFVSGEGGQQMMASGTGGIEIAETSAELSVQQVSQQQELIVLTEDDVKEILEWIDKVQLEGQAEGLLSDAGYKEFRKSLEKELLSLIRPADK